MRHRSRAGAWACSLGRSGIASRMIDHANSAGSSKRTLAAMPSARASSSESHRPMVGCGTTIRSGANGSPGSARMRRASSPASTSIRFEWCSRTASAVPPPDAARDTLRGGAIRHALRDAARHVPHDTACHAAHHQLVFIRSHRFTQPGFPTPGPFRSRRRGPGSASHEKSEVRTGEPIGIELPSEDGALAAVFGWGADRQPGRSSSTRTRKYRS